MSILFQKGKWLTHFVVGFVFLQIQLLVCAVSAYGAAADSTGSSFLPRPVTPASTQCAYYYSDTYANAQSTTPPAAAAQNPSGANYFSSTIALKFASTNSAATPPVPCSGYYEVFFSVDLRNDSGLSCLDGLLSAAVWVTSTDPAMPNVYGCPTLYYQNNNLSDPSNTYTTSPDSSHYFPRACATFSQWSQCAYSSNNISNYNGIHGFATFGYPIFMYSPIWPVGGGMGAWGMLNFTGAFAGQAPWYYTAGGGGPWAPDYYHYEPNFNAFYNGAACWPYDFYYYMSNSSLANEYGMMPSGYFHCSLKPFYFKTIVYLHSGAVISAPSLQSQNVPEPFFSYAQYGYANETLNSICGMSVVGGKFTVTYLGQNP